MSRGGVIGNLVFALLLLGFGIAYHLASGEIPSNALEDPVGAKGFPRLLGLVIIGLAALLVLHALVGLFSSGRNAPRAGIAEVLRAHSPTMLVFATVVVFLAVFDTLGYVVSVALLLIAIFVMTGLRPGVGPLTVAVLGAIAFRLVFGELLGVRFPDGILAFAA